jgi:hypothetical protein
MSNIQESGKFVCAHSKLLLCVSMWSGSCPTSFNSEEHATTTYTEKKLCDAWNSLWTLWKKEIPMSLLGIEPKFFGHLAKSLFIIPSIHFFLYKLHTIMCTYHPTGMLNIRQCLPTPHTHTHSEFSNTYKDDRNLTSSVIIEGQPGRNWTLISNSSPRLQQVSELHRTKHTQKKYRS